jgi:hypothetical protein
MVIKEQVSFPTGRVGRLERRAATVAGADSQKLTVPAQQPDVIREPLPDDVTGGYVNAPWRGFGPRASSRRRAKDVAGPGLVRGSDLGVAPITAVTVALKRFATRIATVPVALAAQSSITYSPAAGRRPVEPGNSNWAHVSVPRSCSAEDTSDEDVGRDQRLDLLGRIAEEVMHDLFGVFAE